jgi:hypothetical protein
MERNAAGDRSGAVRKGALIGVLTAVMCLAAPQFAGGTGNVTVTVNPPQFDPRDGNYAVFSGSVTNAPMPDSNSGCFQFGAVGCGAQFALYPAGIPGSFVLAPQLIWGLQGPSTTPVAVTINMSTSPDVVPGTTYQATLRAYDSSNLLWESPRTPSFQWPPDKLSLSGVRLAESPGGDSTISYQLDHGGTPFNGKARVTGTVFDGSKKLGGFVHRAKAGTSTRLLPDSVDRKLVEGNHYRVRLDAEDPLGRKAHFRGKRER